MLDFGFYNMDCMEGMKQFPDKYFDLAICDPPYGINMGHTCGIGRGGCKSRSVDGTVAVYGESKKSYAHPNFIIPSTIAARLTKGISENLNAFQRTGLFGAETLCLITSVRRLA